MEEGLMAKDIFASGTGFLGLLISATVNPAHADDDCAVLKEIVRNSVHASASAYALDIRLKHDPASRQDGAVGSIATGTLVCANTAEAVTRAFTEALGTLNVPVTWGRGPVNPGDYCLSGDLTRCYPFENPLTPILLPNQLAFVDDVWKGVCNAVASHMPFGPANGIARFTSLSLNSALSFHLKASVDSPYYSYNSPRYGGVGTSLWPAAPPGLHGDHSLP
jgi:hypothetical protein